MHIIQSYRFYNIQINDKFSVSDKKLYIVMKSQYSINNLKTLLQFIFWKERWTN